MTSENIVFTLIVVSLLCWLLYHRAICKRDDIEGDGAPPRRRLRPRSPKDCPQCQCEHSPEEHQKEVIPWSQVKSKRGRPKELVSDGQSCPNHDCDYHGITDQAVHALVGDGVEGVAEPIQWWRCQACGERFSERHDTAMRWLKTP